MDERTAIYLYAILLFCLSYILFYMRYAVRYRTVRQQTRFNKQTNTQSHKILAPRLANSRQCCLSILAASLLLLLQSLLLFATRVGENLNRPWILWKRLFCFLLFYYSLLSPLSIILSFVCLCYSSLVWFQLMCLSLVCC